MTRKHLFDLAVMIGDARVALAGDVLNVFRNPGGQYFLGITFGALGLAHAEVNVGLGVFFLYFSISRRPRLRPNA